MWLAGGVIAACRANEHNAPAAASQASSAEPHEAPAVALGSSAVASGASAVASQAEPVTVAVPGTTSVLVMQPVAGGVVELRSPHEGGDPTRVEVPGFFVATTEVTWDMYDAFVFALDRNQSETDPPDAWARPSKPYILMDRGFGHAGYPAISISFRGATEFCRWLSAKTHHGFRLPTEAEWQLACNLGNEGAASLEERAWCAENSDVEMRSSTHPVAKRHADALGLFDLLGNAAEWTVRVDGSGVARGGSFKDHASELASATRRADDRKLNATDPQIPKSVWWLADGGFVGFRVVMEGSISGSERTLDSPPVRVPPH